MRLDKFLERRPLIGLATESARERLVEELAESTMLISAKRLGKFRGNTDPSRDDFHPLKAANECMKNGNRDEAIWLCFLTVHFGPERKETIRCFYGKLGQGSWGWNAVAQNPSNVRDWMIRNWTRLRHLKFGNHRKYETNNPRKRQGTPAVIKSFIEWVGASGTLSPHLAFASLAADKESPGTAFDRVYKGFKVLRFGRTARFDLLCLLGNLHFLPIAPDHCYLRGATGPKRGALALVTGSKSGRLTVAVEEKIRELQAALSVPMEVLEDAICNWQKTHRPRAHCAGTNSGFSPFPQGS